MDGLQFEKLKELALAATPGNWETYGARVEVSLDRPSDVRLVADAFRVKDAEYIAAANPQVILELLDGYNAACRTLAELRHISKITPD